MDIGQLSDAAVAALESLGIEAKYKDAQRVLHHLPSKYPIDTYDSSKNLVAGLVGNGSKAEAVVGSFSGSSRTRRVLVRL